MAGFLGLCSLKECIGDVARHRPNASTLQGDLSLLEFAGQVPHSKRGENGRQQVESGYAVAVSASRDQWAVIAIPKADMAAQKAV